MILSIMSNHRLEELAFTKELLVSYPEGILNRTIQGGDPEGTHKRRPDFQLENNYNFLLVDINENQHKSYDPIDEERRLRELLGDVDKPLIYMILNPDEYIDKNGKRVGGCFYKDQDGDLQYNLDEFKRRMSKLRMDVGKYRNEAPTVPFVMKTPLFMDQL